MFTPNVHYTMKSEIKMKHLSARGIKSDTVIAPRPDIALDQLKLQNDGMIQNDCIKYVVLK